MKPVRAHPEFLAAIRSTATSRSLIRLYQRLAGEVKKDAEKERPLIPARQAVEVMAHIEGLLRFLDVEFDPRRLNPRRTRTQIGPLDYGGMRRGILVALKRNGHWMTYDEISDAVLAAHNVFLSASARRHFLQKVREAVFWLRRKDLVEPEQADISRDGVKRQHWRLKSIQSRRRPS